MHDALRDRGGSGGECLPEHLATEHLRAADIAALPPEEVHFERLELEQPEQVRELGIHASVRNAQPLVHDRARGRVLEELPLLRVEMMLDGEGGERRLVEAGKNELLLAGIGVDVTD